MTDRVLHEGGAGKVSTQGMREIRTAAQTILGDIKNLSLGRQIVYAKISSAAAIAPGHVVLGPAQVANHSNRLVSSAAAVNAKVVKVVLGATAVAADYYKDGILLVNDADGEGYTYQIERHASAALSTTLTVYLKDGLEVALVTTSETSLIANPYSNVVRGFASAVLTAAPVGVTLQSVAASDGSFVWLGKQGPWAAYSMGTVNTGYNAYIESGGVTVRSTTATTASQVAVGIFMTTAAATEYTIVNFQL